MILITGASGKVGKQLKMEALRPSRQELDLSSPDSIRKYIKKNRPETIIHLAGIIGYSCDKNRKIARQVNVEGTRILYQEAMEYGLKHFVFTSTSGVYRQTEMYPVREFESINPISYYADLKLEAEKFLSFASILRIANIYGEGFEGSLVNRLASGARTQIYNPDRYCRDYVHISDVAKVIEYFTTGDSGVYNVGTGRTRITRDLIAEIEVFGIKTNTENIERQTNDISWLNVEKLSTKYGRISPELILK